jgi:hypothetical protein
MPLFSQCGAVRMSLCIIYVLLATFCRRVPFGSVLDVTTLRHRCQLGLFIAIRARDCTIRYRMSHITMARFQERFFMTPQSWEDNIKEDIKKYGVGIRTWFEYFSGLIVSEVLWVYWRWGNVFTTWSVIDRLCGLVVRVPGYRSRGPGSIPRATRFYWEVVGLERGPLSLVEYNWGATWKKK